MHTFPRLLRNAARTASCLALLALAAAASAITLPRNGRINELPVQRFVFTGVTTVFLQDGTLNILLLDASFDGSGVPLDRPDGFPEALFDRTVVALDAWAAYERLGPDVLRNFRLTGPEYTVLGRTYREVEIDEPNADYIGGRPINISTRARVGPGGDTAVAGFVVEGSSALVLVRGVGPGLQAFGVDGTLPDPFVTLFLGSTPLRFNNDWHTHPDAPRIAALAQEVGAFPLVEGAGDAALIEELPPGAYTVHLTDAGGGSGVGLVEVYVIRGDVAARVP